MQNYQAHRDFFNTYGNMLADPMLPDAAFNLGSMDSPPDFIPGGPQNGMPTGYVAFDVSTLNGGAGLIMPADGRTLVQTSYAGAVDPTVPLANQWYVGWTVWSKDGSDSRPNHEGQ